MQQTFSPNCASTVIHGLSFAYTCNGSDGRMDNAGRRKTQTDSRNALLRKIFQEMNYRNKIVELDRLQMSKKVIPYDEFFLSFRRAAHACYRLDKKFITIFKEKYMIRNSVKDLMCEESRLRELMAIPISDILRYKDMAGSVDPEEALRYLADMFIDNCGESLGMRGFADYCANYWIKKLDLENNPALKEKYQDAFTLGRLLPYISDKYYDGLLDEYDSCAMSALELREELINMLETVTDEKVKIILCAGICDCLSWGDGISWLDDIRRRR